MWEATIETPVEGAALWYRFIARDGNGMGFYYDDEARDGGLGVGQAFVRDDDYLIMAYRPDFKTPNWLKGGVVYQIFPDRFNNGDPANDKQAGSFFYGKETVAQEWGAKPKGTDDFFGGDLKGVIDKLDYLQSLGVTAIYFNPIFTSPSNHRYDTTDYTQIEPSLGTLDTFKELVAKANERGIRLILDGVFNHSSSDSPYFDKFSRYDTQGAFESQQSPYFDWYKFDKWPSNYKAWFGFDTLPAYEETEEVKSFLFKGSDSVVRRWTGAGIGGWRLDAAEQKSHAFWREFRTAAKEADPNAVIIGEYWQNSAPWLSGDQWDGTMNYRFKDAVLGWLASTRPVEQMARRLDSIREDYPPQALAVSMNLIGTHDTRRALTEARGDKNALRLMALLQYTFPGLPTVYYGDEAGLEGGGDPDDRRTYPWGSEDQSLIDFYRALGTARKESSALRTGEFFNLGHNNDLDVYAFARKDPRGVAIVALNRSSEDREIELPVKDVAPVGTTLADRLTAGAEYTVQGDTLKIKVSARWGALLLAK
jgi:glycosidase